MATAAMKNQTDRFYTAAIVFTGCSVYTTLFEPPFPPTMAKLGAQERHGMLGLLEYVPIATFVIPKSPEQGPRLFCRENRILG